MIVKSRYNVLNNIWDEYSNNHIIPEKLPPKWDKQKPITIDDVEMWEEIFYEFGNYGVYAAWSPYAPFYIIAHKQFLKNISTVEIFSGIESEKQIIERIKSFGNSLSMQRSWSDL